MDLKEITTCKNRHPWELSRAECILRVLPQKNIQVFADIGAGDRFFTRKLLKKIPQKIFAVDTGYNENNNEDGVICLNNVDAIENNTIDCLLMMDVLEHIKDDNAFMKTILNKVTPDGYIVITVPAWQFLFSNHDRFVAHYRRYNRKQLEQLLKKNSLKIEKSYYFYTSLFLVRLLQLKFRRDKKESAGNSEVGTWYYSEKNIITIIVKSILNIDFYINKLLNSVHIHLPGLSLLVVCRRRKIEK
jgi:SAM-dependent methyltransferase